MRKTMTYDRGSEMAIHRDFAAANDIQIYCAYPFSPWQCGNENANGLIRKYLPKRTDLSGFTQAKLKAFANRLNNWPRRILGYQSPRTVFGNLLAAEQL